jgi:ABC-2 type transport system permease protein
VSRDFWVIARREFLERVRTKWFVIGTLLGPIFMIALILIPALLARTGGEEAKLQIIDRSGAGAQLGAALATGFGAQGWKATVIDDTPEAALLDRIRDKDINGFLIVPADVLTGGEVIYQGDNASSQAALIKLHQVVTAVVMVRRGALAGIADDQLAKVIAPVNISAKHTTGKAEGTSGMAVFFLGYAVMIILYMAILLYAVAVMRSVVEEKTSRVIELMVAAAKPRALMAGKMLGVGAVGLVQLSIWLVMAGLSMKFRGAMLGSVGLGGGGVELPPLEIGQVLVILTYFVLGYFFYASLYAAVGAMVSSEQEAQQAQTPVVMLLIVPMTCMQLVANDPRGGAATLMTMLPISSPILMPMRYLLGGASLAEVLISLVILIGSMLLVLRGAAKIYRVGILMYGKRPGLAELWRWLRY